MFQLVTAVAEGTQRAFPVVRLEPKAQDGRSIPALKSQGTETGLPGKLRPQRYKNPLNLASEDLISILGSASPAPEALGTLSY